ncbi:MAG: methyltransferase domain-containing protein [Clostridia bacterium]|nr:methyltransferase domain-containing protein [Clostridia bacterium]
MPNISSFQLPHEFLIVGAAVRIGLFDAIKDGSYTVKELSLNLNVDYRALWTITEALAALGYLEYTDDQTVKLTEEAENIFYNPQSDQYKGFSFMHPYNLLNAWVKLPDVIKSGKPVPRKETPSKAHTKYFIKAMSHGAVPAAQEIAQFCLKNLPPKPRVLDVGGGPLTYAVAFAKEGAVVTVLDLPDVIDMMLPELDPSLSIKMIKGDFTKGLPKGPFDLVYMGNICHIYGEKENRKLFQDAANEIASGGFIIINDMIRGTGVFPAIFAVNMLVNTESGGTWTFDQYSSWLLDAGFSVLPYTEVAGRQLITAQKI